MDASAAVDSGSSKRVPQPIAGLDLRSLPLSPEEAFVFSRIDGISTDAEIAEGTGLASAVVAASLKRLEAFGAICFDGGTQPALESHVASPGPTEPTATSPSTEDEATDLDSERKALILRTHSQLGQLNHYQLLGVDPTADRKTIKSTYYKVATVFHPDRYYGKQLGSFKAKLETIFERFTEAERVLSDPSSRAEYDGHLARQNKTRDAEQARFAGSGPPREGTAPTQLASQEPRASHRSPPGSPVPVSMGVAARRPSQRSSSPPSEQRKRALARKLLGTGPSSARWSQPAPTSQQPHERSPISNTDELKRLYEQRSQAVRNAKVDEHLRAAAAALQDKKPVQTAAELRAAAMLTPTDSQRLSQMEGFRQRLAEEMADSYLDQARSEERAGRLADAALSYQKAAAGKPSASTWAAAARCVLESNGDLRRAADLARKAVGLAPEDAQVRLVLAQVFMAAGMRTSALNTLEQASGLAPDDANIRNWLRRLRRGDT